MNYKDEELDVITKLAAGGFSVKEVSVIMEADIEEFISEMQNENSAVHKAYWKGYYSTLVSLRERIMKDAANGSSPAQTLAAKIIEETQIKNLSDGISAR